MNPAAYWYFKEEAGLSPPTQNQLLIDHKAERSKQAAQCACAQASEEPKAAFQEQMDLAELQSLLDLEDLELFKHRYSMARMLGEQKIP